MNRPYRAGLTWCTAGVSVAGPCTSFHPSTLGPPIPAGGVLIIGLAVGSCRRSLIDSEV